MNCDKCEHKQYPDGGWCYMFFSAPVGKCGQFNLIKTVEVH